eukprot:augustus_masked-scaffold_70-processed-gene-0.98-mRNA-1 protein AED:1.00 eAED:1.00 QI:0/0/0/0/1/1/3/0/188
MKLAFENVQTNENGKLTMAGKKVIRGYKQDMTLLNVDIASEEICGKKENTYDVVVRKGVQQFVVCGCLNYGTDMSAAARSRFEKYCSHLRRLKEPIRVKDANGVKYRVTHSGMKLPIIFKAYKDKVMEDELNRIFMSNACGFGDNKSPTQVLRLKHIKCSVNTENEMVVCTARPMGPEKEEFLRNRIK